MAELTDEELMRRIDNDWQDDEARTPQPNIDLALERGLIHPLDKDEWFDADDPQYTFTKKGRKALEGVNHDAD